MSGPYPVYKQPADTRPAMMRDDEARASITQRDTRIRDYRREHFTAAALCALLDPLADPAKDQQVVVRAVAIADAAMAAFDRGGR